MKFTANGKCLLPSHLQSSLCELILKYFNLFEEVVFSISLA